MAANSSPTGASGGGRGTDSGHRDHVGRTTAALDPDIRLTLAARPENVAVVRHVLGALAEALDVPGAVTEDMRLAVTEACTNVVRHAYAGGRGPLDVAVRPKEGELEVTVADAGRGIGRSPDTAGPGLGLPLIAALSDSLEIEGSAGAGSRVTMSFPRTRHTTAAGTA